MTHDFLVQFSLAIGVGTLLVVVAHRLQLPTIVLLLIGGVGLGPEGLGMLRPDAFGDALPARVSLAVGIILFEGGLTLDLRGFAQASGVIRRLLTVGVVVTWLGTAAAIFAVYRFDLRFCLFAASLVIVTGPTVIVPLLRRIHIQPRLHSILHWEGVMIDAIGVFIAILCYEWIVAGEGAQAMLRFGLRVVAGLAVGVVGGFAIDLLIRWRFVAESLVNVFVLAGAVLVFGATELVIPEAGILSVTVAGLVLGWRHPVELKQIKQFKAELTDLLVGTLFVVLAGRLELRRFADFGREGLILLALMLVVVRPLNVLASTFGSTLTWRERLFLAWVAPRGIVAASMASLFALELARSGSEFNGAFFETFVYSVIATTVILQGFSAGIVARLLRLRKPEATGWLIVGAHRLGRELAKFLQNGGHEVTVVDSNPRLVGEAVETGVDARHADALEIAAMEDDERLERVGQVVAVTDNVELNELVCQRWGDRAGRDGRFRWSPARPTSAERTAGRVVWERLPRPSAISAELRRDEATLEGVQLSANSPLPDGHVLALVRRESVVIDPTRGSLVPRAGDRLLVLRRRAGYLLRGLADGSVVDLECASIEEVRQKLSEEAARIEPRIDVEAFVADLAARERLMATFIGRGVGVPHAFVRGVPRRIVVLGRLRHGLRVESQTEPVTLLFLIASPPGDAEGHLATLADVARLCVHLEVRRHLHEAPGREEVLAIVRAALD